jgi:membrane-bound ClpP family serine protease
LIRILSTDVLFSQYTAVFLILIFVSAINALWTNSNGLSSFMSGVAFVFLCATKDNGITGASIGYGIIAFVGGIFMVSFIEYINQALSRKYASTS